MSVPVLTFFNNKGGVGKTSLVYHLAWMFQEIGQQVVAADLDPQANLTAGFLDEETLEGLWDYEGDKGATVHQCLEPLLKVGDIKEAKLVEMSPRLHLLPGDLRLSGFEDALSEQWPASMADVNLYRPFRILSAFWIILQRAAEEVGANVILIDVGPNLGAINRSALIASDYVVIPLAADLFSLQGLRNLGPTVRSWRNLWRKRLDNWSEPAFELPQARIQPIGYVIHQHNVRLTRPVIAYDRWLNRIPKEYRASVLGESGSVSEIPNTAESDPQCLALLKHYRSLMPMAQEANKPIFYLRPADGAIGSHAVAVQDVYRDFEHLANKILEKMELKSQDTPQLERSN